MDRSPFLEGLERRPKLRLRAAPEAQRTGDLVKGQPSLLLLQQGEYGVFHRLNNKNS
jgi:hypothetical protein